MKLTLSKEAIDAVNSNSFGSVVHNVVSSGRITCQPVVKIWRDTLAAKHSGRGFAASITIALYRPRCNIRIFAKNGKVNARHYATLTRVIVHNNWIQAGFSVCAACPRLCYPDIVWPIRRHPRLHGTSPVRNRMSICVDR